MLDCSDGSSEAGNLEVSWHAGWPSAKHDPAPEIQVHAYDPHTVILRQNKSVSHEAPFMFLQFGNSRALLLDTGATANPSYLPLRRTIDELIAAWLADNPRDGYGLIVAHTHGHDDHAAGDGQFADRPDTVVVGRSVDDVIEFYGLDRWPDGAATLDLGGRVRTCCLGQGTTGRPPCSTTDTPGCCSPETRCFPDGSTSKTCRRSPPPWTGCWTSARPDLSATSSAATLK